MKRLLLYSLLVFLFMGHSISTSSAQTPQSANETIKNCLVKVTPSFENYRDCVDAYNKALSEANRYDIYPDTVRQGYFFQAAKAAEKAQSFKLLMDNTFSKEACFVGQQGLFAFSQIETTGPLRSPAKESEQLRKVHDKCIEKGMIAEQP